METKMAWKKVLEICTILRECPEEYLDLKTYLNKITDTCRIEEKFVHKSFQYPNSIIKKKLYSYYGLFIDYFIRRYVAEKINIAFKDKKAEYYLEDLKHYYGDDLEHGITGNVDEEEITPEVAYYRELKEEEIIPGFKDSYEKVIDTKTYKTINILEDILNVSKVGNVWCREKFFEGPLDYDFKNLECIMNYLDVLIIGRNEVSLKPVISGKYFGGDSEMIIDDIIIDIKNSRYDKNSVSDFYEIILYSYGAFDRLKKNIKQFKIYNPLLGKEYEMILNDNIDYNEFEEALKCCVANTEQK